MLIALEGVDGSGKSTVGKAVVSTLKRMAFNAEYLKFPTEEFAKIIKTQTDKNAILHQFIIDHYRFLEWTKKNVYPKTIYILDRSLISMFAYNVRGQCLPEWNIPKLREFFNPFYIDHTYVFEVPLEISNKRIEVKAEDSGINNRTYKQAEFNNLVLNIRAEAKIWSHRTTFIDNYYPYNSLNSVVERIVNDLL